MTAPAKDSTPSRVRSGLDIPNINPATGLSTDYLNHFTEAIMALEMADAMPECLEDLRGWRPLTYAEHFAASRFGNREAAIGAYRLADPTLRRAFDATSEQLNASLAATLETVLRKRPSRPDALARRALGEARPLMARLSGLINGSNEGRARGSTQDAIDVMLGR